MTQPELDIADWRRRVFALYAEVRGAPDPASAHEAWRVGRETLFREHAQSPLCDDPDRTAWQFRTYPYDPAYRFVVDIEAVDDGTPVSVPVGADGVLGLRPFGCTRGLREVVGGELTVFWLEGYGGGVFLPFADATNGGETYGGGRYVLDTIKGADLGRAGAKLVVDFNYAYQPSCSYSPRWICPLPPPENRLAHPLRAGERLE